MKNGMSDTKTFGPICIRTMANSLYVLGQLEKYCNFM